MQTVLFDKVNKSRCLVFEFPAHLERLLPGDIYYLLLTAEMEKFYIPMVVPSKGLAELFSHLIFEEVNGPFEITSTDLLNPGRVLKFRGMGKQPKIILEITCKDAGVFRLELELNQLLETISSYHYHGQQRKLKLQS